MTATHLRLLTAPTASSWLWPPRLLVILPRCAAALRNMPSAKTLLRCSSTDRNCSSKPSSATNRPRRRRVRTPSSARATSACSARSASCIAAALEAVV